MPDDDSLDDFDGICRLFPLPGVVLLPHVVIPLHLFEPRYRQLMEDTLAGGDGLITMVLAQGEPPPPGQKPIIADVACIGRVIQHQRLPDGRFNLLLRGRRRVLLLGELERDTPYRQSRAELIPELDNLDGTFAPRLELIRLFRGTMQRSHPLSPDLISYLESDVPLGALTDLIAHALNLPAATKQEFLAEPSADRRAEALVRLLRRANPPAFRPSIRFPPEFSDN